MADCRWCLSVSICVLWLDHVCRCLSGLLSDVSVLVQLSMENKFPLNFFLVRHQLRHYSPSQVAWIASLQNFFMLFGGIWVGRRLRAQISFGVRSLLPRFRPDDDQHFERILSIHTQPGRLLGDWSQRSLLSGIRMRVNLVPCQTRCRPRPRRCRILHRRRHLSHHGHPPYSRGWLRLGDAHLRFPHPGLAHLRQSGRNIKDRAYTSSLQLDDFRPPVEGASVRGIDSCQHHVFLGHVHSFHFHCC